MYLKGVLQGGDRGWKSHHLWAIPEEIGDSFAAIPAGGRLNRNSQNSFLKRNLFIKKVPRNGRRLLFESTEPWWPDRSFLRSGAVVCRRRLRLPREVGGEAKNDVFRWNWRITSFSQTWDILKNEYYYCDFCGEVLDQEQSNYNFVFLKSTIFFGYLRGAFDLL